MAIKENNSRYDVLEDNPLVSSVYNYGFNSTSVIPIPTANFMITEITEDFMITESGDFMITQF